MATSIQLSSVTTKQNFPIVHQDSKPINVLPINSDIIAHAFEYLDGFDIDNASAACREWRLASQKNLNRETLSIKRLGNSLFYSLTSALREKTYKVYLNDDAKKIAAELIKLIPLPHERTIYEYNCAVIKRFSNAFFLSNSQRINILLKQLNYLYSNKETDKSLYAKLESELKDLVESLDPRILEDLQKLSNEFGIDLKEKFTSLVKDTFFYFNSDLIDSLNKFSIEASPLSFFNSAHCILTSLNAQLFGLFEGIEKHKILDQDSELATAITPLKKHKECNTTLLSLKELLENKELTEQVNKAFDTLLESGEYHLAFQIVWKIKDKNKRNQILMNIAAKLLKSGNNKELAINLINKYLPEESLATIPSIINAITALIIINEKELALELFREIFGESPNYDLARESLFMSLAKENAAEIPFILESLRFSHDEINSMLDKVNNFTPAEKELFYSQIGMGFGSCFTNLENLYFSINEKYLPLLELIFRKTDNRRNKATLFSNIAKYDKSFPPNFLYRTLSNLHSSAGNLSEYICIIQSTVRSLIEIGSLESAEDIARIFIDKRHRFSGLLSPRAKQENENLIIECNLALKNIETQKMSQNDFIVQLKQLIVTGKAKEAALSLRKRFKDAYNYNNALKTLLMSLSDEDIAITISCVIKDPEINYKDISLIINDICDEANQIYIYHKITQKFILNLFNNRNSNSHLSFEKQMSPLIHFFKQASKEGKTSIINALVQLAKKIYLSNFICEVLVKIFDKNHLSLSNVIFLESLVELFFNKNSLAEANLIAKIIESQANKVSILNQSLKNDLKEAHRKVLSSIEDRINQ